MIGKSLYDYTVNDVSGLFYENVDAVVIVDPSIDRNPESITTLSWTSGSISMNQTRRSQANTRFSLTTQAYLNPSTAAV